MNWLIDPEAWIGLAMLVALEVVLGIDNIIFITVLSSKLPPSQQPRARRLGLLAAMVSRILLLASLSWLVHLTGALVTIGPHHVSGQDVVLIVGGLFLVAKSVLEIHDRLEGAEGHVSARAVPSLRAVIVQIMLMDVVFSLDSVVTAVGMVNELAVMVTAVILAVLVMMVFVEPVNDFVARRPTVKMLALSFLLLIGTTLLLDGLGISVPKGYVYFAMAFAVFVEMLNLRIRPPAAEPVHLRDPVSARSSPPGAAPRISGGAA